MAKPVKEKWEIWINHTRCDAGWVLWHRVPSKEDSTQPDYIQTAIGVVLRKHKTRYTQSVIEATTRAIEAIPENLHRLPVSIISPISNVIENEREEGDWGYDEHICLREALSKRRIKPSYRFIDKDHEAMVEFKKIITEKAMEMRELNPEFIPDYTAFTDGSCNNLSPYREGGAAYVVVKDGVIVTQNSKGFVGTSNNRMELLAVISAVNWLPDGASMLIKTDSRYCITMLDHDKCPSKINKNEDLIRKYYRLRENKGQIGFEWVKGHSGVEFNELADSLADSRREEMRVAHNIPEYNKYNSPKCRRQ